MKIVTNSDKKYKESFEWHKWFAWYPVSDGNTIVWLEVIERQRVGGWCGAFWDYRII